MKTQTDRLRNYLDMGLAINPLVAWRELGIYRLASRVLDLKREGYPISSQMINVNNTFSETVRVAEYRKAI